MNKNYTEIAFVLDRSGSMASCKDAAIDGFNHFLKEQQAVEGLAKLTLALFDDEYLVPVQSTPVSDVVPLNSRTYSPRNTTALLDAIGRTIDELGGRLSKMPEEERPGQVIVTILTDGLENASKQFTWEDIAKKIKHQTDVYSWTFLFLGANQDAIATAATMNISSHNSATFQADHAGSKASMSSASIRVSAMRKQTMGIVSEEVLDCMKQSLSDILKEEDTKERKKTKK